MKHLLNGAEKNRDLILEAERFIWEHAETGYKEFETSRYLEDAFEKLGYHLTKAEGITGFYTVLDTGLEGPEILILGEMDSVICHSHKQANKQTGAVHACGHNTHCAALLGIAAALKEEGALEGLCGKIKLCAVPAEELLELEYRSELKKQGKINYFGGKVEFLSRGYFDSSDIAFMFHSGINFGVNLGNVGCLTKTITYKGKASHAGGAPWNGINALYAANCGLNAINAIRETFMDKDLVRVHPIISNGGSMVNAIPDEVKLESYVRANSFEAIEQNNKKVNRALCGAALSLGANIEIEDTMGYAPNKNNEDLIELTLEAVKLALPNEEIVRNDSFSSGSTDMGELSCLMPTVHPNAGGTSGTSHGADFIVSDPGRACVSSAKAQLAMLYLLLKDNAKRAKKIIANFKPQFASREEYFEYTSKLNSSGERIDYSEDKATVKL